MRKRDAEYLENGVECRRVALVDGWFKTVRISTLVGICHSPAHEGYLTAELMKKHDCIAKNCPRFEKLGDYPYWVEHNRKENVRTRHKEAIRHERELTRASEEKLEHEIVIRFNAAKELADSLGYDILITGIVRRRETANEYIINYVSDRCRDDWYEYIELARAMSRRFRGKYILKHSKFIDGRYATIDEWAKVTANIT